MRKWDTETAEWYAEKYGEYATNKLGLESLEFKADSSVVDIGCGTGCALRHASEKSTKGTLIGIDPVPRMIEIAREKTSWHVAEDRINYYEGSAKDLPVKESFADVVVAFDSYDHWQNQAIGLKEVRRILKSNGLFVVLKDGGLPNVAGAKKEFLSCLKVAGFRVVRENEIGEGDVKFSQWVCVAESQFETEQAKQAAATDSSTCHFFANAR